MNKKKLIIVGIGLVAVLSVSIGIILMNKTGQIPKVPSTVVTNSSTVANQILSATKNGVITLYDTSTGKAVNTFDLKSLSIGKQIYVAPPIEDKPQVIPIIPPVIATVIVPDTIVTFKDFVKVPVNIIKGNTSWAIQSKLTPNRKTEDMLELVNQVNEGKSLHPIYPGEVRIYLREKGINEKINAVKDTPKEAPKKEVPKKTVPKKEIPKKETKKLDESAIFIYSKSEDLKTMYAYNEYENSFYSVTVENHKLVGKLLLANPNVLGVKEFKVSDNSIYIYGNAINKVRKITISNPDKVIDAQLDGAISNWIVKNNIIYYTYGNNVGKYSYKNSERISASLGDASSDILFIKEKLYILNQFGIKSNNSVLFKVNALDLKIDALIQLKSDTNVVLTKYGENIINIGQIEKTTELNKKITKEAKVAPINLVKFEKGLGIKDIDYLNGNAIGNDNFLYILKDGKIKIYTLANAKFDKDINVKGIEFMPIQ